MAKLHSSHCVHVTFIGEIGIYINRFVQKKKKKRALYH